MIKKNSEMDTPVAFIASSSEALPIATTVQELLRPDVDSVIWSQDFFKPGSETLRTLVNKAMLYDAGVILFTNDDLSEIRGELYDVARDNAIFESGLLMGRLSKERAFIILEKGVNVPSDLYGITSVPFEKTAAAGAYNHITTAAESIKKAVLSYHSKAHFGMLPSSALAMGYFQNFVKQVVANLNGSTTVVYPDGTTAKPVALKVLLPCGIDEDMQVEIGFRSKELGLIKAQLTRGGLRNLSVFCRAMKDLEQVEICDIPSTLSVLKSLARVVFNGESIGDAEETDIAVKRELTNFSRALEIMIRNDPAARRLVSVEWLPCQA